jgi:3-deoxy-manno-octulosonate cytidylyltransferase (CMP-KDO synthetase)
VVKFAVHPVPFRNPFERTSQPARVVAVIPARFQSSRLPGKPLADLAGQPMIERVYRRAAAAPHVDAVVVATDDARIAMTVEHFGGIARMTRSIHRTGTDRVAEVAADLSCEIVINVQGDLPLIEPEMIAQVLAPFDSDPEVPMATLRRRITDAAELSDPNVAKVVADRHGHALYFSRAPSPYPRDLPQAGVPQFKHFGLYAYRRDFLLLLTTLPQTPLEVAESLEQLRVLEHGYRIRVVETPYDTIEVNTPEDLERARQHLAAGNAPPNAGPADTVMPASAARWP